MYVRSRLTNATTRLRVQEQVLADSVDWIICPASPDVRVTGLAFVTFFTLIHTQPLAVTSRWPGALFVHRIGASSPPGFPVAAAAGDAPQQGCQLPKRRVLPLAASSVVIWCRRYHTLDLDPVSLQHCRCSLNRPVLFGCHRSSFVRFPP